VNLTGALGADSLVGGALADTFNTTAGTDTMSGGAGNDLFIVSAASGIGAGTSIDGGADTDTLQFGATGFTTSFTADLRSVSLSNLENISFVRTNAVAGTTIGVTFGADQLSGAAYAVSADANSAAANNAADTITVTVDASGRSSTNLSGLTFSATSNLVAAPDGTSDPANIVFNTTTGANASYVLGTAVSDNITGGAGADTLFGGAGNDTITGGTGADVLSGGTGVDTFSFAAGAGGGADGAAVADVITDFVASTDKLQFTGVTDVVSVQQTAVQLAVTALAAGSTEAQIATAMALANTTNLGVSFAVFAGNTYVYFETVGATGTHVEAANVFIRLTGVTTLPTFAADVVA
jgi:Ca2+-binding RTX toxin-like protein